MQTSLYAHKAQEVAAFRAAEAVEVDKAQERRRVVEQRREFLRRQRTAVQKAAALQVGVDEASSLVADALAFLQVAAVCKPCAVGCLRVPVTDCLAALHRRQCAG